MQQFTKNIEKPHRAKILSYDDSKKVKEVAMNIGQKKYNSKALKKL
jgi:hypothetical protein